MTGTFSVGDTVAIVSHDGSMKALAKVVRISPGGLTTQTDDGNTWVSSTGKPYGDFGRDLDMIRPANATDLLIEAVARDISGCCISDTSTKAAAARAIAAVRRWEAENGWRCVPKEWSPEMWKVWEECEGGGEMEFQAVVSASPHPPGSAEGVKP